MSFFYIIGGIILLVLIANLYEKYISIPYNNLLERFRFSRNYSKRLATLKDKITEFDFDEVNSNLNELNSSIEMNSQELEKIKRSMLKTEQKELEKYLSTNAHKFLH